MENAATVKMLSDVYTKLEKVEHKSFSHSENINKLLALYNNVDNMVDTAYSFIRKAIRQGKYGVTLTIDDDKPLSADTLYCVFKTVMNSHGYSVNKNSKTEYYISWKNVLSADEPVNVKTIIDRLNSEQGVIDGMADTVENLLNDMEYHVEKDDMSPDEEVKLVKQVIKNIETIEKNIASEYNTICKELHIDVK